MVEPYAKLTGPARTKLAGELAELYLRGHSIRDLMRLTSRSYGAVRLLLTRDAGITLRSRGGNNNPGGRQCGRRRARKGR